MRPLPILLAALLLLPAAAPAAETDIKPGLWKHTFKIGSESGRLEAAIEEMQRQMEQMPAEQRQMMEQMMRHQGMQPGGSAVEICLRGDEFSRGELPEQEGCRQEIVERKGNRLRIRFLCEGDPPSSGEGEFVIQDSTHYTGSARVNAELDGEPDVMRIEQVGEWIADDCGDVQPVE